MDERWSEQKRQQDIDDLNNEAAGRDVGRQRRFLPDRDPDHIEKTNKDKDARLTALMQIMRDADYAAAYQRAWDAVGDAQDALDTALLENAEETERLEEELRQHEERATRLADGSLVFRAEDGSLRDADDNRLRSDALPASLTIPGDAPTYEEYAATRDALMSARTRGDELSRIQTEVIDPARDRLNDHDNPPDADELDRIREQMDQIRQDLYEGRMPEVAVPDASDQRPADLPPTTPISIPSFD